MILFLLVPKDMTCHLSGWKDIFQSFFPTWKGPLSLFVEILYRLICLLFYTSAEREIQAYHLYVRNSDGPKTVPSVTPDITGLEKDSSPSIEFFLLENLLSNSKDYCLYHNDLISNEDFYDGLYQMLSKF